MCGIAGYYSLNKEKFSQEELRDSINVLNHRGPDSQGFYFNQPIGLGSCRLNIIDLSDRANQPMHSADGRYTIVYNGEVYNYMDIAKELNVPLKTSSDTEVILESYIRWGNACVNKFNGMFAFAIYDNKEQKLFLARDAIGIKPLFYYWDGDNFMFGSEIKSLLKNKFIQNKKKINKHVIPSFFSLGFIPEPHTIYDCIYKFPSGNYAVVNDTGLSITQYWKPEDEILPEPIDDFQEAKTTLKELLISSVNYRLISDVPYGVFLSGGQDSSLITAIAQSLVKHPVKTFTIGFKEEKYNEAPFAKQVASYLGTDHNEYLLSHQDAIEYVEHFLNIYDEPYANTSCIPSLLIAKLARQQVKMALTGEGGDELFYGYGSYQWAKRLSNPLIRFSRKPVGKIFSYMPSRYRRIGHLLDHDLQNINPHIFSQEQYFFSDDEMSGMLTDESIGAQVKYSAKDTKRKLFAVEAQSLFDLKYYLKDDLLVKSDRATMKYSMEARNPYLDNRIIRLALNINPALKMKGNTMKYLTKQILYDYIPEKYFQRPKQGFSIPLQVWLKKELKYLMDKYLSESIINQYEIVNYSMVKEMQREFLRGDDFLYHRLWLIIILHKWLDDNL